MYEVTQESRRVWKVNGTILIEQCTEKPKARFDLVSSTYSMDEDRLRQLHAAIGRCLTDLAAEKTPLLDEIPA
jgi:hypothetical protein